MIAAILALCLVNSVTLIFIVAKLWEIDIKIDKLIEYENEFAGSDKSM